VYKYKVSSTIVASPNHDAVADVSATITGKRKVMGTGYIFGILSQITHKTFCYICNYLHETYLYEISFLVRQCRAILFTDMYLLLNS
jgi:hypothetical protein